MIDSIRTVAVLGAGGTIGALTGGIVAQSGRKVYLLSRHKERAETGLVRTMDQARSDVI
ncbi:MAG: 3-hydroxyacyl-CoA dehydrogenase family protein, partial [Verrucomicrobia bacterium]|nr:3-hydroxyacyl-CoA dehydrogenase family protein [Verrucomicrobiota bacterium]